MSLTKVKIAGLLLLCLTTFSFAQTNVNNLTQLNNQMGFGTTAINISNITTLGAPNFLTIAGPLTANTSSAFTISGTDSYNVTSARTNGFTGTYTGANATVFLDAGAGKNATLSSLIFTGVTIANTSSNDRIVRAANGGTANLDDVLITNATVANGTNGYNAFLLTQAGGIMNITNSFIGGTAFTAGAMNTTGGNGVIASNAGTMNIDNTQFQYNSINGTAGSTLITNTGALNITGNSLFANNRTQGAGNIIANNAGTMTVTDSVFDRNTTASAAGGAITNTAALNITGSTFKNNTSGSTGGAIDNSASGAVNIYGGTSFLNNTSGTHGGAINATGTSVVNITADGNGDVTFDGNTAANQGGAIRVDANATLNVTADGGNVVFSNNKSGTSGGAIQSVAGTSQINLTAQNGNITFEGNSDGTGAEDMNVGNVANLTVNNGDITFNDSITSSAASANSINISGTNGSVVLNADMKGHGLATGDTGFNGTVTLNSGTIKMADDSYFFNSPFIGNGGTLDRQNGSLGTIDMSNFTLNGNVNEKIDVDLASAAGSFFSDTAGTASGGGQIMISDIRLLSNAKGTTDVPVGDAAASPFLNLAPNYTLNGAIYTYNVSYIPTDGASDAFLEFIAASVAPAGFMPQVTMQGAYLNQLNAYATVLNYVGTENPCLDGRCSSYGLWVRPYGFKESVDYRDGVKVKERNAGIYVGFDTRKYDIGRDYNADFTVFAGYNDLNHDYEDVDIDQNSVALGAAAGLYKGNAFAGLTLSGTAGNGTARSNLGSADYSMETYGAALKLGYNARLSKVFVLQPSITGAYTMVSLSDFDDEVGNPVRANTLSPFTIEPGVKLLAGLSKSTYARAGISYAYTTNDKPVAYISGIQLPEIYTSNYLEYTVGAEHQFTDNFSAGLDLYARNLDRTGVGAALDLRYLFGKECKPLPVAPVAEQPVPAEAEQPVPAAQPENGPLFERNVLFGFDKYYVRAGDKDYLLKEIARLKQSGYYEIKIQGHTDNIGTKAYNQKLSVRRANAVYKVFKEQGVTDNVTVQGFGLTKPVATNKTKEGRAQNRRVEIIALKKI
ncbi:MAG: OmpA family protein [Elusimicrobia bacterium]|nr:OmpA family protein [Elusimicrobiota bacterium]